MKKLLRIVFWLAVLAGCVALVVFALRPTPVLVDLAIVERGHLSVTIDEDGVTRIKERYVVSTPLAGRLQRVNLQVGDPVAADSTVLARMQPTDPSLLDPRALAQAEARVKAAERRLEAAKAERQKVKTAVEYAASELARVTELLKRSAISPAEFEQRQFDYRVRSEEARGADFGVDIAEYELELDQAALLLTDPSTENASPGDRGTELAIKAPIDGRVLRIYRESAAVLDAGASIIEIGDPMDLEIVCDVLSIDAVRASSGAAVSLENWGGEGRLLGEVRIVEPSGFTKISALGVEEQRVNVIIDFVDPPEVRKSLGDGFRVDAKIVVWQQDNVLKIPTSSLFRIDRQWHVFVVRKGFAEQIPVDIGQNNGIEAQVLNGLEAGESVIMHPSDTITSGVRVEQRG